MRRPPLIFLIMLLAGCASSNNGRTQFVAPDALASAYSELGLRARLALAADNECSEADCAATADFRGQVEDVGEKLSRAAFTLYPELEDRFPLFVLSVPAKNELGALSHGGGSIIVFDRMSELGMDDRALGFVIAREMGHIIGRHHQENTAISLLASFAAQLVLPISGLIRGAAAALPATSASTTATSSVASLAGSRMLQSIYHEDQRDEADIIAFKLLRHAGMDLTEVSRAISLTAIHLANTEENGWIADFRQSKTWLDLQDCSAPWATGPELVAATLNDMQRIYDSSTSATQTSMKN